MVAGVRNVPWRAAGVVVLLAAVVSGCAESSSGPTIRVGYAGVLDVGDVAAEIAHADSAAAGYVVREQGFATIESLVDALARGDVDVGTGAARAFWAASAKGADLRTVMEHVGNVHRLVSQGQASDCAAVDRRRLALQSEGAAGTALARAYLATHCPDARPDDPDDSRFAQSAGRGTGWRGGCHRAAALRRGSTRAHRARPLYDRRRLLARVAGADGHRRPRQCPVCTRTTGARAGLRASARVGQPPCRGRSRRSRAPCPPHARRRRGLERPSGRLRRHAGLAPQGGLTRTGVDDTLRFLTERSGLDATLTSDRIADLSVLEDCTRRTQRRVGHAVTSAPLRPISSADPIVTAWRLGLPCLLFGLWELLASRVDTLLLPSASNTVGALFRLLAASEFWAAMWTSHQPFVAGFTAAALIGVPVGLALGRWPTLGAWFRPHLQILLVTPMSAVIPLVILVAGLSIWARSFVVFAFALPVVASHAEAGMRLTDVRLLDMARAFGASPLQVTWRVRLPAAGPSVLAGLRLGLGRAFAGMIVGELVLMAAGIGGLLLKYQADFDAASVYAVAVVVVAEALLLMRVGRRVERRLSAWQDRPVGA